MNDRVAIYVRVSALNGRGGDSFISPDVQEGSCRAFCDRSGLTIDRVVEELDRSASGKAQRKKLEALIEAVRAKELDGIVVYNLSRFSRLGPVARAQLFDRVESVGGKVLSATEDNDVSTPQGRFVRELFLALARLEWENRAEGFEIAKEHAVARGIHIAGKPPYGYTKGDDRRLVPNPETGPIVTELFIRRSAGESYGSLMAWLDEVAPRENSWGKQTIRRILQNRTYLGEVRQGEHLNEAAHPALVEPEVFDTVQALGSRREPSTHPTVSSQALLAGLVCCSECKYALSRSFSGRYWVYRHKHPSPCTAPSMITMDNLDRYVTEEALAYGEFHYATSENDRERDELRKKIAEIGAKRLPFEDPEYVALIGLDAAKRARAKVDEDVAALEAKLAELVVESQMPDFVAAREGWDEATVDERREVLASVIQGVLVSAAPRGTALVDRVEIRWVGEAPIVRPDWRRAGDDSEVGPGVLAA